MSADQQTFWLASAVEALGDIWASEVAEVSHVVRRNVTRHSQIVPEVARLVTGLREQKAQRAKMRYEAALPPPPAKKHVMERDRRSFTASDWAELNEHLERMGSPVRYGSDGTKLAA